MITDSVKIYIDLVEKIIEFIEGKRRKQAVLSAPLGETLEKVETAQSHLTDAIEAIDIIRKQVIAERVELDTLLTEVADKKHQYKEATDDLKTTQEVLNKDREKLRIALGFNSSRERIIGFVSGVIASVIATAIWVFGSKLWTWINTLIESKA